MDRVLAIPKMLGPWGRQSAPNWEFKLRVGETIKGVIINEGWIIDGIGFIVNNNGNTTTKYFGGPGGDHRQEITFNPDEVITHISGTYGEFTPKGGDTQIASIKVHTNHNSNGYGPYGKEMGVNNIRQFSTPEPLESDVVVGFFGSAGTFLESIGVYIAELKEDFKKHGPWGSQSPANWELMFVTGQTIKGIIINEGWIIDGIGFIFIDNDGKTNTTYFGGPGGTRKEITLLITHISGTYGEYSNGGGRTAIATIKIHTNYNPSGYGPYGEGLGVNNVRQFSITEPLAGYAAVGFFGSADTFLESIGFYSTEITPNPNELITQVAETDGEYSPSGGQTASIKSITNHIASGYGAYQKKIGVSSVSMISTKQVTVRRHGPWGSESPPNWEWKLGFGETIKGVVINEGSIVDGIGFNVADKDGKTATFYFGGLGGNRREITLNPDELITYISGTYGEYKGQNAIASIKIHTNSNPGGYGPYGKEIGVSNVLPFSITEPLAGHVAVGFFGSIGTYLESIGVYITESAVDVKGVWAR